MYILYIWYYINDDLDISFHFIRRSQDPERLSNVIKGHMPAELGLRENCGWHVAVLIPTQVFFNGPVTSLLKLWDSWFARQYFSVKIGPRCPLPVTSPARLSIKCTKQHVHQSNCANSLILLSRDLESMLVSGPWGLWNNETYEFKSG